jgi:hypothetical protein
MTYAILEATPNPLLHLTPTTTVFTGTVKLGRQGASYAMRGQPAQEFSFFVPDAPPLDEAADPPPVWAEAHLMHMMTTNTRQEIGVDQVTAAYLPDPRGGTARWLHCSGLAHAPFNIRIGYRITVTSAP